jgi:hypothetical protein
MLQGLGEAVMRGDCALKCVRRMRAEELLPVGKEVGAAPVAGHTLSIVACRHVESHASHDALQFACLLK